MEWESAIKEKEEVNVDLGERVILLEKAAEQLEIDNRELAKKLQESLTHADLIDGSDQRQHLQCKFTAYSSLVEMFAIVVIIHRLL